MRASASTAMVSHSFDRRQRVTLAPHSSMSIYQFLIAVRQQDGQQLMNEAGETTSHLMGLFYRCVRRVVAHRLVR